jgi:hypothetical protein
MEQQSRAVNQLSGKPTNILPVRSKRRFLCLRFVVCFLLLNALHPGVASVQGETASEYELKAAMLFNLTRFVEWPSAAYSDSQAPTVLCILGRDPFGASLTSLTAERAVNGRAVVIRHAAKNRELQACHVLYISSSERKDLVQIIKTLKGANVLTVGEMTQFAARGGMIQFSLEEKQVRFAINLDAAARADLKISSRLLVLARIVKSEGADSSGEGSPMGPEERDMAGLRFPPAKAELERKSQEFPISIHADDERRRRK